MPDSTQNPNPCPKSKNPKSNIQKLKAKSNLGGLAFTNWIPPKIPKSKPLAQNPKIQNPKSKS
jgi:hypothetical protein